MSCGTCEDNSLNRITKRAYEAIEKGKKLTTKDRKKMSKSTFCGPGRSFPVNDCQHAATAKAYLGRSKFSASTKKKIAACINRRAKALGCKPGKKAKASEWTDDYSPKYIELGHEEKELYSSEMFAETKQLVEESIKSPDMDLDW
jgi:hypothetical protein